MSDAEERPRSAGIPIWRKTAGAAVLAILVWMGIVLAPVYWHNFQLEKMLSEVTLLSEADVRQTVLQRGRALGLDISPNQLQVQRQPGSGRFAVRYAVRVSLVPYTVELHFSSTIRGSNGP